MGENIASRMPSSSSGELSTSKEIIGPMSEGLPPGVSDIDCQNSSSEPIFLETLGAAREEAIPDRDPQVEEEIFGRDPFEP